ncbi:hypothetical protein BBK36DRAFT_1184972 [Trichoderma citrinoviride]|uniref:Secreted protein n=1 Tax=Trichoderma citrinoviride TaxID=58853 RepID=A0A2T4AZ36_9HYPO|nr:hypothetical protein BBK36DRAFT_1184972 [Trichoderma citrinoviride]PTB62332.1 hypothetical protein BBK36DRAFT_1184972 [Trichoderma citrinoviride]
MPSIALGTLRLLLLLHSSPLLVNDACDRPSRQHYPSRRTQPRRVQSATRTRTCSSKEHEGRRQTRGGGQRQLVESLCNSLQGGHGRVPTPDAKASLCDKLMANLVRNGPASADSRQSALGFHLAKVAGTSWGSLTGMA